MRKRRIWLRQTPSTRNVPIYVAATLKQVIDILKTTLTTPCEHPLRIIRLVPMCGCTLYDSPTCGHSWVSMSQPCGFLSDLLNCPYRQTYQTLIAPPYTCPICNGGFADAETIEMVQGPWGCNQMLPGQVGGSYAIPGQWGHAPLTSSGWGGPAITSAAMQPMSGYSYDHRLTGPYGSRSMLANTPMITNGPVISNAPMVCDSYGAFDDGYISDYDHWRGYGRGRRRHKTKHKYKYTSEPVTNCTVM